MRTFDQFIKFKELREYRSAVYELIEITLNSDHILSIQEVDLKFRQKAIRVRMIDNIHYDIDPRSYQEAIDRLIPILSDTAYDNLSRSFKNDESRSGIIKL